jgi:alkylation response protein AidB-like acyl-CoA dehydrogenase
MDYGFGEKADRLRGTLRRLIADEVPQGFLGAFTDDPADLELTHRFVRLLAERNLLTIAWPARYGGSDGSLWEQAVLREEMWAHHEPRGAQYMGLNWVGPAIMAHGTAEQKAMHLSKIARGEVTWCQGFSEPEAGSDLAALRTRATRVDGGWVVSGQKIWTSYAAMADFCVLAARTGDPGSRHAGISLFLVPMDRDGITVRPIDAVLGPHHLNECFFDDVFAADSEVLGAVDGGWGVIRTALAHERVGIARYARCERLLWLARDELDAVWSELAAPLRAAWVRALVQVRVARLLAYRTIAAQEDGGAGAMEGSQARIASTTTDQLVADTLAQLLGPASLLAATDAAPLHGAAEDHWRYALAATVASGTIEIQRLIVSRALLSEGSSRA